MLGFGREFESAVCFKRRDVVAMWVLGLRLVPLVTQQVTGVQFALLP